MNPNSLANKWNESVRFNTGHLLAPENVRAEKYHLQYKMLRCEPELCEWPCGIHRSDSCTAPPFLLRMWHLAPNENSAWTICD